MVSHPSSSSLTHVGVLPIQPTANEKISQAELSLHSYATLTVPGDNRFLAVEGLRILRGSMCNRPKMPPVH